MEIYLIYVYHPGKKEAYYFDLVRRNPEKIIKNKAPYGCFIKELPIRWNTDVTLHPLPDDVDRQYILEQLQ